MAPRPSPASKWSSLGSKGGGWNGGPRGIMLYFPLAVSLALNSLWLSNKMGGSSEVAPEHTKVNLPKLLINGEVCGGGILEDVQSQFYDVVLIISFKDDATAHNASDFLRDVYGRFFKAVVVCAPSEDEELGIETRGFRSWGKNQAYQYYFFPKIAARYQDAAGFLFLTADVVLNYWNLIHADKAKLWLAEAPECTTCKQGLVPLNSKNPDGTSVLTHNPLESAVQRNGVTGALGRIEKELKAQFERSMDTNTGMYPTRIGDVFYVPQRFAYKLAFELIPAFRDFAVFQDIAIPAMFYALEPPSEYDPALNNIVYLPDSKVMNVTDQWDKGAPAFHPWELVTLKQRAKLLGAFGEVDHCLKKLVEAASAVPS